MDYSRLPNHQVLCIDMVSFYASVEAVVRGLDPRKVMLAVVGDKDRSGSVVLAASPMLKKRYGIKTGKRRYEIPNDPEIWIVDARMSLYLDMSMMIPKILSQYAPMEAISVYSVDEAWICVDGCSKLFGSTWEIAQQIQKRIEIELGLPSAIGIGPNKLLAKLVLDNYGKKIGIAECTYEDVPKLLWPLPIGEIWGIGSRLQVRLNKMGIYTLKDLAMSSLARLKKRFGIMGEQLYYHAWGIDLSPVFVDPREEERKGFSSGITLLRDYHRSEVPIVIYELTDRISSKLRKIGCMAKTVSVSLGYSKYENKRSFSRSKTLQEASNVSKYIYQACMELLAEEPSHAAIRHIHVGVSQLVTDKIVQMDLFPNPEAEQLQSIGKAMDTIQGKFGPQAILRASSLTSSGTALASAHKIGGHKG